MSQALHLILASVLLLMGVLTLRQVIRNGYSFDLFQWAVMVFCFYGGLGVWVVFAYDSFQLPEVPEQPLLVAYFGVCLFLIGILAIRRLARHRQNLDGNYVKLIMRFAKPNIPIMIWAIFIVTWLVRLKMAVDYNLFFSGTWSAERVLLMPSWLRTADALVNSLNAGLLFWLCSYQMHKKWRSFPAWGMLLMEMLWFFIRGRRWIMTFGLIVILAICVYKDRINFKSIGVATVILASVLFVLMPLFQATRLTFGEKSLNTGAIETTVTAIGKACEGMWEDQYEEGRRLRDLHREELKYRPLVFHYSWEIAEALESSDPMFGWALVRDVLHACRFVIPTPVFDYKKELGDLPGSEQLIQRHFGWAEFDTEGTWPAVALADFGLLGCFLYGMIFGLILWVFELFISYSMLRAPHLATIVFGTAFYSFAFPDVGPETVLNALRAAVVVMLAFWALGGPKAFRKSTAAECFVPGRMS